MHAALLEHTKSRVERTRFAWFKARWRLVGIGLLVLAAVIYAVVLALNWPFTNQRVIDALQEASLRTVTIQHFRKTFFPPGCVAEGVHFEHREHKNNPPIIAIQSLTLQGSYWGLVTDQYRLSLVRIIHMHVTVPPKEVNGKPDPIMPLNRTSSGKTLRIDKIIADGALLDFVHQDGSKPYRLTIDKLALYNVSNNSAIRYKTILSNSLPAGKIRSEGVFGPWDPAVPAHTPVEGNYSFENANLAGFQDLSGTLQSQGTFQGNLGEIKAAGKVDISQFQVRDTSHQRELKADYNVRIDGTKGDTTIDQLRASFDRSSLDVKGTILAKHQDKGPEVSLDLLCSKGRIEDVLDLFIESRRPPMTGAVQMKAHLDVPPGPENFLRRMKMQGSFDVENGQFTDEETQSDLNRLSQSADKKQQVAHTSGAALSDLNGRGDIENGVAKLSNLKFQIPGARAEMDGTYSLLNYDIDLRGKLYTVGQPSAAITGFHSWLLRAITPFFKKRHDARVVPFKITGSYQQVKLGLNL